MGSPSGPLWFLLGKIVGVKSHRASKPVSSNERNSRAPGYMPHRSLSAPDRLFEERRVIGAKARCSPLGFFRTVSHGRRAQPYFAQCNDNSGSYRVRSTAGWCYEDTESCRSLPRAANTAFERRSTSPPIQLGDASLDTSSVLTRSIGRTGPVLGEKHMV
ncbi:hypothetical protein BC827DRAFT_391525 [Russula dissimulans]|nr:hypothetical protein BC827DRAFT_391525 [Russula dissimulans]